MLVIVLNYWKLLKKAFNYFGTTNCKAMIGNAGLSRRCNVIHADLNIWNKIFQVNLMANVQLTRLFAPIFVANKFGHFIYNNSSASSSIITSAPGVAAYYSSKHGLNAFANVCFDDLREFGVKVSNIFPSNINNSLGNKPGPMTLLLGKDLIQNEDICDAIMFCLTASTTACPTHVFIQTQKMLYTGLTEVRNKLWDIDRDRYEEKERLLSKL